MAGPLSTFFMIPFYKNLKDNNHCAQACLKSVLKFYFPHKNYSFKEIDKATAHKKGRWTWNSVILLFLVKQDFEVINIENCDYKTFAKRGEKFLKEGWTKEVYETQRRYSDFAQEQKLAKILLTNKQIKLEERYAKFSDIRKLFKEGYLMIIPINPYVLSGQKGYVSHTVVVQKLLKKTIIFHDPGLPPRPNRKTTLKKFYRAMAYPHKYNANIIAVRKKHVCK